MAGILDNATQLITYGSGVPWSLTVTFSFMSSLPNEYIGTDNGYGVEFGNYGDRCVIPELR